MVLINHEYPVDILIMENISNNNDIINHLLKKNACIMEVPNGILFV